MSKYNSRKVIYDNLTFDSKKEARRYQELKILENAGVIKELKTQVKFVLIPAQREPSTFNSRGKKIKGKLVERECSYIADFTYLEEDEQGVLNLVVEDVKGFKKGQAYALFKIKKKLMLYVHNIRVIEI